MHCLRFSSLMPGMSGGKLVNDISEAAYNHCPLQCLILFPPSSRLTVVFACLSIRAASIAPSSMAPFVRRERLDWIEREDERESNSMVNPLP